MELRRSLMGVAVAALFVSGCSPKPSKPPGPSNGDWSFCRLLKNEKPVESHGDITRLRTDVFKVHMSFASIQRQLVESGWRAKAGGGPISSYLPKSLPPGYTYLYVLVTAPLGSDPDWETSDLSTVTVYRSTAQGRLRPDLANKPRPKKGNSHAHDRVKAIMEEIDHRKKLSVPDRDCLFELARSGDQLDEALGFLGLQVAVRANLIQPSQFGDLSEEEASKKDTHMGLFFCSSLMSVYNLNGTGDERLSKIKKALFQEYFPHDQLNASEQTYIATAMNSPFASARAEAAGILFEKVGLDKGSVSWMTSRLDKAIAVVGGKEREYWIRVKRIFLARNPAK